MNIEILADKQVESLYGLLVDQLSYLSKSKRVKVHEAYLWASELHKNQTRGSGEPYITHPLYVALQCAEWKLDDQVIVTCLLHDTIEDCGISQSDVARRFGNKVGELVQSLTKLEKVRYSNKEQRQAESFRKLLLAMSKDIRVMLIKLSDRLHNIRTIGFIPENRRRNICVETLDIYAPLAYRLGLNMAYRELQNLAWKALFPWRFQVLTKAVNNIRQRYAGLIHTIEMQVQNACSAEGLEVKTFGREKSIYSIYSKMVGRNLTFAQINDVYGMRILVKSHIDCYTTLGLLHRIYKPLPGLFKDYTANPKPNGYQSLHTTVVVSSGFRIEIQIRTEDMHLVAESGAAAHWIYKNQNPGPNMATFKPIRSLMEIQEVTQDSGEFWLATKADLDIDDAADTVYVFTPRGKIVELPFGSTPIDFAYAIHRDMGSHVAAAKINNEPVLLNAKLNNGDVVEIETDPLACPQSSWLKIVATTRARQNIKSYINSLNQKEARNLGVILLSQALRAEGIRDLPDFYDANLPLWQELLQMSHRKSMPDILLGIGLGHESSLHYAKHIVTILSRLGVAPDTWLMHKARATWEHNMATESFMITNENFHTLQPAKCCYPILGDRVVCQFIRGQGLFIHNYQCKIIQNAQKKHPEQYISSLWDDDFVQEFKIPLVLEVKEAPGVLSFFTNQVNHCESEVYTASRDELVFQSSKEKFIQVKLMIGVYNLEHLQKVIKNLQSPNVKNIVARPEEDAINEVH